MTSLIIFYYAGLLIFALNGLQWMAMRNEARKIQLQQERIRKLLLTTRRRK